jgi:hypothetical protein
LFAGLEDTTALITDSRLPDEPCERVSVAVGEFVLTDHEATEIVIPARKLGGRGLRLLLDGSAKT